MYSDALNIGDIINIKILITIELLHSVLQNKIFT